MNVENARVADDVTGQMRNQAVPLDVFIMFMEAVAEALPRPAGLRLLETFQELLGPKKPKVRRQR